jgi:hypothetical protein
MSKLVAMFFTLPIVCGCQSATHRADPASLNDFARTDAIEIRTKTQVQRITDVETINRLQQIYHDAEWRVYRYTLPASIMERIIYLYDNDEKLRRLCYAGRLWEFDASDDVRTANVSDDDHAWLDQLFDPLIATPNGE